jgi:hypothetical protein
MFTTWVLLVLMPVPMFTEVDQPPLTTMFIEPPPPITLVMEEVETMGVTMVEVGVTMVEVGVTMVEDVTMGVGMVLAYPMVWDGLSLVLLLVVQSLVVVEVIMGEHLLWSMFQLLLLQVYLLVINLYQLPNKNL